MTSNAAAVPSVRWYWWVVIGAAGLLAAVAVALSVATLAAYQNVPRALVGNYLTALEHGKAGDAMHLAGIKANSGDVLLTDAAYAKATNRISSFSLARPVIHGNSATIDATIRQGDHSRHQTFAIERAGGLPGLPLWKFGAVETDLVDVLVTGPVGLTFTVAGQHPSSMLIGSATTLRAFPGTYPVKFQSPNAAYVVWNADATSIPAGNKVVPTNFVAQLSSAGTDQARQAVDAWLDACLASTEAEPADCPFLVQSDDAVTLSDLHWQLVHRPDIGVDPAWTIGGWAVESSADGSVTATAKLTRTSDGATGTGSSDEIVFQIRGIISFDDTGAIFTPYFGGAQG
ncbi:hypothetical protein [Leifsonia poae]|uniref:hypothetical protein n=1 Tax=Leifsonia poae TaxID=110933 RepID=UPI003D672734